jgi:hypothetical protein
LKVSLSQNTLQQLDAIWPGYASGAPEAYAWWGIYFANNILEREHRKSPVRLANKHAETIDAREQHILIEIFSDFASCCAMFLASNAPGYRLRSGAS